jgi:hypothetical protein
MMIVASDKSNVSFVRKGHCLNSIINQLNNYIRQNCVGIAKQSEDIFKS